MNPNIPLHAVALAQTGNLEVFVSQGPGQEINYYTTFIEAYMHALKTHATLDGHRYTPGATNFIKGKEDRADFVPIHFVLEAPAPTVYQPFIPVGKSAGFNAVSFLVGEERAAFSETNNRLAQKVMLLCQYARRGQLEDKGKKILGCLYNVLRERLPEGLEGDIVAYDVLESYFSTKH